MKSELKNFGEKITSINDGSFFVETKAWTSKEWIRYENISLASLEVS